MENVLGLGGPVTTIAIAHIVALLVYTLSLWGSAKIIGDEAKLLDFFIIVAIAGVFGLILDLLASAFLHDVTSLGAVISIVVLFVLLSRWMGFLKALFICFIAHFLRLGLFNGLLWIFARLTAVPPPRWRNRSTLANDHHLTGRIDFSLSILPISS